MWQLQGLDSAVFVSEHWQKKPCVLRNAFAIPGTGNLSPLSPEELAGLACEEDVQSRLVIEKGGEHPWQVRYGPFNEQDFLELPDSHYSLLVSECEKWIPELSALLTQFRFIPDWRIDDLMISYAPGEGSVGPHIDEYDVFLLQAMGKRRWQFCDSRSGQPQLIPGLELAILKEFIPDQEVVLNPGDMLYLPPGIAHHGVAQEPCMTYSIGFRAPSAINTLESVLHEAEILGLDVRRYRDPGLEVNRHHAEITQTEIEGLRSLALEFLQQSDEHWRDAIGKMLTDSAVSESENFDQSLDVADLQNYIWVKHPETRILYNQAGDNIAVFYNGRAQELPLDQNVLELLQQLCGEHEWHASLINACIQTGCLGTLLLDLASTGAIVPLED